MVLLNPGSHLATTNQPWTKYYKYFEPVSGIRVVLKYTAASRDWEYYTAAMCTIVFTSITEAKKCKHVQQKFWKQKVQEIILTLYIDIVDTIVSKHSDTLYMITDIVYSTQLAR